MEDFSNSIPKWLDALFKEDFFDSCLNHDKLKSNEKNIFCIDCCSKFCHYCLLSHPRHRYVRVRKYHDQALIKIEEMEKLINCSFVQTYSLNRATVIYLNKREPSQPCCRYTKFCFCGRSLPKTYRYCSVSCKVESIAMSQEDSLSSYLRDSDLMTLLPTNESDLEEDHKLSPEPILHNSDCVSLLPTNGSDIEEHHKLLPMNKDGLEPVLHNFENDHQFFHEPILDDRTVADDDNRMLRSENGKFANSAGGLVGKRRRKGVPKRSPFF